MIELLANIILRFECLQGEVTIDNFACIYISSIEATFPYIRIFLDQSWYVQVRKIIQVRKVCVRYVWMRLEPYCEDFTSNLVQSVKLHLQNACFTRIEISI